MEFSNELCRIALHDPIVHKCLSLAYLGYCTKEEALEKAIIALSKLNTELIDKKVEEEMKKPPNVDFINEITQQE